MKRASLAVVLALIAVGCGSSTTAPTAPANPVFTQTLLPANETPSITAPDPEAGATGTATITFVTTKDASGNITSATASATVTLSGFPAGSTITNAHIHTGAAGVSGGVLIPFPPGTISPANGTFTWTANPQPTADQATQILNNPGGFYFNVHTALHGGGVMRAQLVRTQ
jgi:CHRD domain